MLTVTPTQAQIQAALRAFCENVLPIGVDVIEAQDNRVPEPQSGSFVVMTPLRRQILATNIHTVFDCAFTASIAGTVMTVTVMQVTGLGIQVGAVVSGPGVTTGTRVVAQLTGTPGGVGTYTVTPTQTAASATYQAGQDIVTGMFQLDMQLGFHAADNTSGDAAQVVAQMLRDTYATEFIAAVNPAIRPLYAGPPRQAPFINAEDQFEWQWIVECVLQANFEINIQQQFATSATMNLIDVDVVFPPNPPPVAVPYTTEDGAFFYVTEDGLNRYVWSGP